MRRIYLLLFILAVLALFIRMAAIARFGIDNIVTYSESGVTANNWVSGRGYTFDFYGLRIAQPLQAFIPPLYTAVVVISLQAANPARTLEFIQALLSALTVVTLFLFAYRLTARLDIAWLSALGAAFYPVLVLMCAIPIQTILNILLLSLLMLACAILRLRLTVMGGIIAGVLMGLNLLTRPALLGFIPLLFLWLWMNVAAPRRQFARVAAAVLLAAGVTVLPWMLRNYQLFGEIGLVSTNGGITFWDGNNEFTTGSDFDVYTERVDRFLGLALDPAAPEIANFSPYPMPKEIAPQVGTMGEVALERALYAAGFDFALTHPAQELELIVAKIVGFWWFRPNIGESFEDAWLGYYQVLYVVLLALFVPGLFLSRREWRPYSLLYLLFLYNTFVYAGYSFLTRFRWEIELFFLIFAAGTLAWMWGKAKGSTARDAGPALNGVVGPSL